jgi:hypothetical protein
MQLIKRLAKQLAVVMTCVSCSAASPVDPSLPAPDPRAATVVPPQDVRIVDQAELDELRKSVKYDIAESGGEVTASAACTSGEVDQRCVDDAHQRLREAAAQKDANLALIEKVATLQSYPPRYSVTAVLYNITERR